MKRIIILAIIISTMLISGCEKKGGYNDTGVILVEDTLYPEWVGDRYPNTIK